MPLAARGLTVRRRGQQVLGPLDLDLGRTGLTLVIGPNGAGKTTLLKVLYGLIRPSSGTVTWAAPQNEVRAAQAYVFQTPVMLRRSVEGNLAYPLALAGLARDEIAARVADWSGRIGLSHMLERPAPQLSGGERQKLALARALITAPQVLFLDEPCANLDGRATSEIEDVLRAAHESGTRIVMTSHSAGQIRRLATDYVLLHKGLRLASGPSADLANPAHPQLAAFLNGDLMP